SLLIATALRVRFSRRRCGLALVIATALRLRFSRRCSGDVIATALRVRFSRRRCGLARGLGRSRRCAGLVCSKRTAQHRVQPSEGRRSREWFGRGLLAVVSGLPAAVRASSLLAPEHPEAPLRAAAATGCLRRGGPVVWRADVRDLFPAAAT